MALLEPGLPLRGGTGQHNPTQYADFVVVVGVVVVGVDVVVVGVVVVVGWWCRPGPDAPVEPGTVVEVGSVVEVGAMVVVGVER